MRLFSAKRDDRLACPSPPSLNHVSRPPRSSRRTTNTTRRDFWTKCVCRTVVVWKGTLRDPPRRAARMELKRVSCACFGGRSFAMSLLASLTRTDERTNKRRTLVDLGLHFNSQMLAELPYNQERFHCTVESTALRLECTPLFIHKPF